MLIARIRQRIIDALHERHIRALCREHRICKKQGRHVLAEAVARDVMHAVSMRSPQQIARMDAKALASADPHARPFVVRQCRDRQA